MQHQPRKRFGQNFLVDQQIISQIIRAIQPREHDHLVEIGPGLGALTLQLLPIVKVMDAIEIDRDLVIELSRLSAPLGTLLLHSADALRFDFRALMQEERRLRIIGNLPYNISTPLLFHLLEKIDVIQDMHFMLQKEVVERMVAMPGDDAYGRLSVMLQYYCEAQALFTVGAHAFKPAPKVASAVIRLKPHRTLPHVCKDVKILAQVVKLAFGQRRKTIRNSLKTWVTPTELLTLEIDPQIRPERLGVKDFVRIANFKTFLSS